MVVLWELNGQKIMGLNCGPIYKFSPANTYVIECETQEEIDQYWEKLGEGGNTVNADDWMINLEFLGRFYLKFWAN